MKKFVLIFLTLYSGNISALDIIQQRNPTSEFVIIKLLFQNGSASDPYTRKGICALTADLLADDATANLSAALLNQHLPPLTTGVEVVVDKEITLFTFQIRSEWLDSLYPAFRDAFIVPVFSSAGFYRMKEKQLNYLQKDIRSAANAVYSRLLLENFLFADTEYQFPVFGTEPGINAIALHEVKGFYYSHFGSANLTIGISGKFPQSFAGMLFEDFTSYNSSVSLVQPGELSAPASYGCSVKIVAKDSAKFTTIAAGFPISSKCTIEEYASLLIAGHWLNGCCKRSSGLSEKLQQRALPAGKTSLNGSMFGFELFAGALPQRMSYFVFSIDSLTTASDLKKQNSELIGIETGNAQFALRLALFEIAGILNAGLAATDFERARMDVLDRIDTRNLTPEQNLNYALYRSINGSKDPINIDSVFTAIDAAKVNAAIRKYWQTENIQVVLLTDRSEAIPVARACRDNLPSPIRYTTAFSSGLNESILSEDKLIEVFPLRNMEIEIFESNEMFR